MKSNVWIKDKWYCLDSSGKMLRNTYTPEAIMSATQVLGNKDKMSSFLIEGRGFLLALIHVSSFVLKPFLCYNERYEN